VAAQQYITALRWAGKHARAEQEALRGVTIGLWGSDPWQRPARYVSGLRARRFWRADEAAPGLCASLHAAREGIAAELRVLLGGGDGCAAQDEGLHTHNSTWRVCDVLHRCELADPRVEFTCAALLGWRALEGGGGASTPPKRNVLLGEAPLAAARITSAQFSVLWGGGVIRPHTGTSNTRLVLHFTIGNPEGASIRVGGSPWHPFVSDDCIALDDSFEHEVVHPGRAPRANLVVQLAHPDLRLHGHVLPN
jgi:hypothetical protein